MDDSLMVERLKNLLSPGSIMVYFASGTQIPRAYNELPWDNIILVDRLFRRRRGRVRGQHRAVIRKYRNVITVGVEDLLDAVVLFYRSEITIDAVVVINEGLGEGGGKYPVACNQFMGFIMPLLAEKWRFFTCPKYYTYKDGHSVYDPVFRNMLKLPYKIKKMAKNHPDYINPEIFTEYDIKEDEMPQYTCEEFHKKTVSKTIRGTKVSFIHDSMSTVKKSCLRHENTGEKLSHSPPG